MGLVTMASLESTQTYQTQHELGFDLIRSVAIFLVICLHVSGVGFANYFSSSWAAVNAYESFSRVCVPLFFILSGALLLDKRESLQQLGRRISKIVIASAAWSAIFIAWERRHGSNISFFRMIEAPVAFHLWYCYTIIGAYLFLPVMRAVAQYLNIYSHLFIIGCWVLSVSGVDLLNQFAHITVGLDLKYYQSYFGFFLIGNLLIKTRKFQSRWVTLFAVGWILMVLGTYFSTQMLSKLQGQAVGFFYSYYSPFNIFGSIFAFLFLREVGRTISVVRMAQQILKHLSRASFGIYLFHPFALDQLSRRFKIDYQTGSSWIWIPLTSLACLSISWVVVSVIQRIPVLRRICP